MKSYMIVVVIGFLSMSLLQAQTFSLNNKSSSNIIIDVWQVNNRRAIKQLIERQWVDIGNNYSFDVEEMTGKDCSLVVDISLADIGVWEVGDFTTSDMYVERYYLSGESKGNNFFVSYAQGWDGINRLFPSRAAKVNNVTIKGIFSLGSGDKFPINSGDDIDAMIVESYD